MVEEALRSSFIVRKFTDRRHRRGHHGGSPGFPPPPCWPGPSLPESAETLRICSVPSARKGFLALDGIRDPATWEPYCASPTGSPRRGLASDDTVELLNPKVVQATMGALFRVKFRYCDLPSACRAAAFAGGKVYGTFLDGENLYAKTLETGSDLPVLLVIGNEARGISSAVAGEVAERLYIPSFPREERGSESLNAAVAAAVAVAEFRRRT